VSTSDADAPTDTTPDAQARSQVVSTLRDLDRQAVDLRAAIESGSASAASTQVHIIDALVREELEWWSAQPAAVTQNDELRAYHDLLTALDTAANEVDKGASVARFHDALSALLALRPVMDRGG
jgi:hypothetical protein